MTDCIFRHPFLLCRHRGPLAAKTLRHVVLDAVIHPKLVGQRPDIIGKCRGGNLCYAHLAIARATSLRLVMRHLAPLPTSDARFCSAAAAAGLRRALRIAAMRLWASCRFI